MASNRKNPQLGSFGLVETIARGGQGEVWRAAYRGPGARRFKPSTAGIAIKVLTAASSRDPSYLHAFRNEIQAIAGLDHPNILTVLDYGRVDDRAQSASGGRLVAGSPWLAMELANDGTLHSRLGTLPWPDVRRVLQELLAALAHAHARGVIHRDIKPGNVLFGGWRGGLKLADFGLAHAMDRSTSEPVSAEVAGTPSYMAPEQFLGRTAEFGPWTDLYALGCLAYSLVCSKRPYEIEGGDFDATRHAHLTWPLPALSPVIAVPSRLESWLHTLLCKDPQGRFSSPADAAWALETLGEALPAGQQVAELPLLAADRSSTQAASAELTLEPTSEVPPPPLDGEATYRYEGSTGADWPRPPLPDRWQETDAPAPVTRFVGAGLGLYGLRTVPLVDREAERDLLWQALARAEGEGMVQVVVLEGAAGCGKSRLARWLSERAYELGGIRSFRSVHDPDGGTTNGLVPMVARVLNCASLDAHEVKARLRDRFGGHGDADEAEELAALTALLSPGGSELSGADDEESADERYALLLRLLRRTAQERPFVLWLDDVHWGPDALSFVEYLLRTSQGGPITVLLTARTEDLAFRAEEAGRLEQLAEHEDVRKLTVGPLPRSSRGQFIEQVLGLRGDLAAKVRARTAGNPLFAVQLVGDWVERGVLEPSRSGFALRDDSAADLPENLRGIWAQRVDLLLESRPPGESTALEIAAVLGRHVNYEEWHDACARLKGSPGDLAQALVEQRLAEPDGRRGWSFVHGMLHESLEQRVQHAGRWAELHATAVAMLQDRGGPSVRLGRHLVEAARPGEAMPHLEDGVREHLHRGEFGQAQVTLTLLDRAMAEAHLAEADPRRCQGMLLNARLARLQGHIDEATESLGKLEDLAVRHDLEEIRGEVAAEGAIVAYRAGDLDSVLARCREGERLAQELGETRWLARCLELRARTFTDRGSLDQAESAYLAAIQQYRSSNVELGEATCQLGLGWVAMTREELTAAYEHVRAAHETCSLLGARRLIAVSLNMLGEVERKRGHLTASEEYYRQALQRHRTYGSLGGAVTQLNLALVQIELGKYHQAHPMVQEVISTIQASGARQFLGAARLIELTCIAGRGLFDEWSSVHEEASALLEESGLVHDDLAEVSTIAARLARDAGEEDKAQQAYQLAVDQWTGLGKEERARALQIERKE